jgi:hypothetical protein
MAEIGWPALRRQLERLPPEELLELLGALCRRSADNRRFLAARLGRGDEGSSVLEDYRARLLAEFASPGRMPRLGAARRAVGDYRKATGDVRGTADLMLAYVEAGTAFSREHGDMSEAYYDSLGIVLRQLAEMLQEDPDLRALLLPRLRALGQASRRVGWSWGGFVRDLLDTLERAGR